MKKFNHRPHDHHPHAHWHHPGPWGPEPGGHGRPGRRMRRGDTRVALLRALLDGPAHGYELMSRLEERSAGMWRPSAGSVYPTLQLLEEQGAIRGRDEDGKRVYELTDDGRREAEAAAAEQPFANAGSSAHFALRGALKGLILASRQVAAAGEGDQVERAVAIVTEARQKLYRLLAGDD